MDGYIDIIPWPILKIMVKVMQVLTANIMLTVTDTVNIAIAIK